MLRCVMFGASPAVPRQRRAQCGIHSARVLNSDGVGIISLQGGGSLKAGRVDMLFSTTEKRILLFLDLSGV